MQSKSLVFLFIVVVTIPIIALSTNHEIFFGVAALIITVLSIRYIYRLITGETFQITEVDEELEEELEELMDIDVKRFGTGLSIVYHLLVILFLSYCALFMETIVLKSIAALAILLQIHFIINKIKNRTEIFNPDQFKPQLIMASILNIAVILFTLVNKLYKLK